MKYIALLRGINVGGKNHVAMKDLKKAFETVGMENVSTYINSGNVVFISEEKNIFLLTKKIEKQLHAFFSVPIPTLLISEVLYRNILAKVPQEWKMKKDIRCYIAFLFPSVTPQQVEKSVVLKEGVDRLDSGNEVVYMTTKLSGLTKSGFTKLIGTKIYKEMTMRNYTTCLKLLDLLQ